MRGNKQCSNALFKVRNGFLKSGEILVELFVSSRIQAFLADRHNYMEVYALRANTLV